MFSVNSGYQELCWSALSVQANNEVWGVIGNGKQDPAGVADDLFSLTVPQCGRRMTRVE